MAAPAPLETRHARSAGPDRHGTVPAATACLDRQDLARAPLYALQAWLCCAAIAAIATPTLAPGAALRLAALLLALPLPWRCSCSSTPARLVLGVPRGNTALTGLSTR
jgi:hypothetical protein